MSFPATLKLTNASAVEETWIRLHDDGSKVTYSLEDASLNEPCLMVIGHQMTSSPKGSDRHLVKFATTVLDTENNPYTEVQTFTQSVPRVGVSAGHCADNVARFASFMTVSNQAAILRGER